MRLSNVDTLSALFDRLICENIKRFFFEKDGNTTGRDHQDDMIYELKKRINGVFIDCKINQRYEYIDEQRTFGISDITETLEELIYNDINIGEADRARLAEATSNNPDINIMSRNEKRLRLANEGRAANKNSIDKILKKEIED